MKQEASQLQREVVHQGKNISHIDLTRNYRNDEEIINIAKNVRRGVPISELLSLSLPVNFIPAKDEKEAINACIWVVANLVNKGVAQNEFMVLSPTRTKAAGTEVLNNEIRKALGISSRIPGTKFFINDVIVARRNDYKEIDLKSKYVPPRLRKMRTDRKDVYNGTRGIITGYENGLVNVTYIHPYDGNCTYNPAELDYYIEPAFALTVHKAQGDQAKHVILVLTTGQYNRSLIYTGITRCFKKGKLTIIADQGFIENPAYAQEDWMDMSLKELDDQLLPAERCLSQLYWKIIDNLGIEYREI